MQDLAPLFEPVIESMGYELVGVEYQLNGSYGTLRVYIDREQGVSLDDCAEISRQVSAILDVEDPIQQAYDLEISSPGLDRPLFKLADYERFSGQTVKVKLLSGLDGPAIVVAYDLSNVRNRHLVQTRLGASSDSIGDLRASYLKCWGIHGDTNFQQVLDKLEVQS